jgi:uncharacterized secreted repeat protein (TIGR03808 family)
MPFDRRRLFAVLAGIASASAASPALARNDREFAPPALAQNPMARDAAARSSLDGTSLGIRPNAAEDQSAALQRAIDHAAANHAVLHLPPGFYRAGDLHLPPHTAIAGTPGATRIVMAGGPSVMSSAGSDYINLSGLILDGAGIPLPDRRGLIHLAQGHAVRIADCEIVTSGRNGISLEAVEGEVIGNTISTVADIAIFSIDARGLRIAGNTIRSAGNGGVLVWRSKPGDDGTLVTDNRIEDISARAGGEGQWGNAVNVFRADNVMVRGNRIRNAAFTAVRGNSASNLQITGNTCSSLGEVALYAEFSFEGAVIANNIVDGAAVGVSVTNSNVGGRLGVVQGNLIRNLHSSRPQDATAKPVPAIGIGIEADTVASGNVVENVEGIGIAVGYGPYLRDVAVSANVVRSTDIGIGVSVAPGAGSVVIADNLISEARRGAIVGMEWDKTVTGDLSKDGAARYAQLSIGGNRVR